MGLRGHLILASGVKYVTKVNPTDFGSHFSKVVICSREIEALKLVRENPLPRNADQPHDTFTLL